ncbi:MAG: 5'/3'-nucleotidase SurE [Muribaculaceae bacterium]|nr:5'/3'-nucleotidase SurE [Muribaculaceae bacterium]
MDNTTAERPLVLITNDDSIDAPGLHALAALAAEWAEVVCVAPRRPQSGKSSAMTVGEALRIAETRPDTAVPGVKYYTVDNGTPVDCVKIALYTIVPRRPDFLFSGINHGSNAGVNVLYSGTMGAVLEGAVEGIPSAGFSLLHHSMSADFSLSTDILRNIMARFRAEPPAPGICLNINIPAHITPKGVRACRACHGRWSDGYQRYTDPHRRDFFMLAGLFVNEEPEATDTDEYWLAQGYVTVVPVDSDMTARSAVAAAATTYDTAR